MEIVVHKFFFSIGMTGQLGGHMCNGFWTLDFAKMFCRIWCFVVWKMVNGKTKWAAQATGIECKKFLVRKNSSRIVWWKIEPNEFSVNLNYPLKEFSVRLLNPLMYSKLFVISLDDLSLSKFLYLKTFWYIYSFLPGRDVHPNKSKIGDERCGRA